MIQIEIILLTNNIVLPFQQLKQDYQLDFIELNKLFATKSLAEHGLGFLINVYDVQDSDNFIKSKLLKKIIFDTGGPNLTFLHNSDLRGYQFYDTDVLVLSHWHYDHSGGLLKILERIEEELPVICHESATFERFFRREKNLKIEDLEGKSREEILPLLSSTKIVNQAPIDLKKIKSNHIEEDFNNFFSLQEGTLKTDKILDDKCLILEFDENIVLINGCCHSGLMNTLDYVKNFSSKPISHIIGGFHMAAASEERIRITIDYLNTLNIFDDTLYIFPIHCSGEKIIEMVNKTTNSRIKAFNTSVGTIFNF
jgi:7,8-dihydropterin-6-yl-methyl-4-(beta-D-ribofuranosyl)aminobenzene 5'-phosphate synthase